MKNGKTRSDVASKRAQDLLTSVLLCFFINAHSPQLPDGSTLALPKVATAQFGSDPNKRTVCVYGHVDVQPAKLEDGWATEPYNLTDINGNSS